MGKEQIIFIFDRFAGQKKPIYIVPTRNKHKAIISVLSKYCFVYSETKSNLIDITAWCKTALDFAVGRRTISLKLSQFDCEQKVKEILWKIHKKMQE